MGDRVRHGEMQQKQRQGQREDAGARSKVRQHREVVQPSSFAANNRSRPAELTAQGPPQLQLRPIEGARGPWGWPRAPRGLCLRRRENGFGFTLRHFIVYPPESYTILQGDRRLWGGVLAPGSGLKSIDEPMDTIFVKSVKENSPAHAAGLATGDRIISVNGETIGGKTYAEVVQLIQQSTKFLHLLVVPKEDDILQLYFADTAHNPETNQRPAVPSSMRSPEAMLRSSAHRQQQHHQQFSHLPKPRPYRPTAGEATAQAPSSPRCPSGGGAAAVAPSSLPDGAVFQQNPSQQPHSWHLVARAHPVVTRRSSDTNLRIREADVYCDPYQVEETEDHRRTSGGSGWSSESGGVRSSLPVGAFSPRPLHSPPSYCSVDGSEGTLGHDSNGSLHSLPTSYGSPFCSLDPRRRDSTVSLPPTMRCDGFRDGGPPASPGGSGACYPEDEDDSAVTDSVMRRIRKSFEQKEEFLRRPTQPIWLPQTSAAIPREFYAHPQKFQRPPWPPNQQNGGEADDSPSSPSKQLVGPPSPAVVVSRKGGAECVEGGGGGGGSQHGRPRHSTKSFVTTLSRITENLPAQAGGVPGAASPTPPQSPPPALQLVSRRARQFESGEVAEEGEVVVDKTNFYRSELSRLSSKRSVPNVAVRKREFECRGKESRSFDGSELPAVPSPSDQRRRSRSNSADDSWAAGATSAWVQKHHAQPSIQQPQIQQQTPHQQPPSHQQQQGVHQQQTPQQHQHPPEAWRSSQGDSSTISVDTSPNAGRRLVRQHSYLAAVKKPIHAGHFAMQEDGDSDSDECWGSMGRERGSEEASEPKRRSQALRPTHLDIPHPIRPASLQAPPSPDEDVGGDSSTTAGTPTSFPAAPAAPASTPEEGATTFPPGGGAPHYLAAPPQELEAAPGGPPPYGNRPSPTLQTAPARSSPAVIRRQKTASQIEDEAERVVRRVSYLKATWGDRMHVDSDLELSDGEQATSGHLRPHDLDQSSRSSSTSDAVMVSGIPQPSSAVSASAARQSHGILRLRSLFTDRQHHHQDAAASNTIITNLHSGSNKENQHLAKEGWLQCKFTVVEGKRSADRSWKQVRAILRGSYLHLVKDRKESSASQQQTPGMMLGQSSSSATGSVATLTSSSGTAGTTTSSSSSSSSSEEVVDVRHGVVDVAGDYTKRKHVFRLSAGPGGPGTHSSELLLQAEDSIDMLQWIRALQESGCRPEAPTPLVSTEKENSAEVTPNGSSMAQGAIGTTQGIHSAQPIGPNSACAGSSAAASAYVNRLSPLPAHKGIRKLTSFRNRSPTGQSPVNKTRKASQGDQLPSPKSKTWKGRVAKQFRRIQQGGGASSPSSPTAPRPEGVTIGIPLEDCPQSTFCEFVPLLVELCTSIVEARGLDIIGIYRVPGNTAAVASLTEGVNRGFDCINMQDARWNDVNVISSLLKLFFRRLPDSLLTSELYPLFIESDKIEGPERRIATIRKLVHELPDHHFETLKYLLYHLKKVVSHCHVNKMEARNLAIVFGPTLVRTADDNMVTMVTDMSHQCRIVETLISHVDWFFSDEDTDDLSSIPFDVCAEAGESGDASGANQNLLLNNIQKVEGMKADSPSKEISAKDIVSSIISAANRKMQKAKGRKGGGGGGGGGGVGGQEDFGECISEHRDNDKQGCDKQRSKEEGGQQSRGQGEVREGAEGGRHGSTSEEQRQQRVSVASSILGSVIFSGNIVKSIHESEANHHNNSEDHGEVISPANHEEEISPPSQLDHRGPPFSVGQPVDLGGTIRTYAGLSATTQERIRRFELETRAMLQRDIAAKQRSSDGDQLGLQISTERGPDSSPHNKETRESAPVFIKPMAHASDESSSPEVSRALVSAPIQSSSTRPRLHSHPTHHQRNSSPSTRQSGLCPPPPHDPPSSVGIQSPLGDSGNMLHPVSEKLNFLEEGAPLGNLRRGNSAENLARQTGIQGQRGLVSEQLDFNTHKIAPNGTLKRLKTECEQPQMGGEIGAIRLPPTPTAVRRGSLDSLQEAYGQEGRDRPSSDVSDDGSDLLASLTSTFDKKLRSLLGPGASHSSGEHHSAQVSPREGHPEEAEESIPGNSKTTPLNSSLEESNHRLPERTGATAQQEPEKWSTRKEKEAAADAGEEKVTRGGGDRRSKSSTAETTSTDVVDSKPRRSDSLSKTEKTEANTKTKDGERQWRRREAGVKRGGDDEAKLKRKNGMPDRSIKRRHTVGGTKDFDKIEWAVGNGRDGDRVNAATVPDEKDRGVVDCEEVGLRAWLGRERLRTSSPDLGCRRAIGGGLVVEINVLLPGAVVGRCGVVRADSGPGGVGARPHGLPTTRVHEQPLESHV